MLGAVVVRVSVVVVCATAVVLAARWWAWAPAAPGTEPGGTENSAGEAAATPQARHRQSPPPPRGRLASEQPERMGGPREAAGHESAQPTRADRLGLASDTAAVRSHPSGPAETETAVTPAPADEPPEFFERAERQGGDARP